MEELYHIVKNRHIFDDKWCNIAQELNIPHLIPQGIHSSMMCFAGMNSGKINAGIFEYIIAGYGYLERVNEFINIFRKHNVIDKNFNLISWNKHQKPILHNNRIAVESQLSSVDKKLSLVESGVEYLVDKKVDPKLYQAWYFQRVKKGLSCKDSYEILTQKGYVIETRLHSTQPTNHTQEVEQKLSTVEKVETPQRVRVIEEKRREENIIKKTKAKKDLIFNKPTIEEITEFCSSRQNSVDPEVFYHHYESTGWMKGGEPIKSWQSTMISWEKRNFNQSINFSSVYEPTNNQSTNFSTTSFQSHRNGKCTTPRYQTTEDIKRADFESYCQRRAVQ
jgi:hypothetical protein